MDDTFSKTIVTAGGGIAAILCLPASTSSGAPLLVCVHGGGCNGRYFDLKGNSLARAATDRGLPVLLVDRPGYGASAPPDSSDSPIAKGADAVRSLITAVREAQPDMELRQVAMVGHSIGGAVALTYAAHEAEPPLAALCVSGIGDSPSAQALDFTRSCAGKVEPPAEWFFGPEGTYGWKGVAALRAASEPWRSDEVHEVLRVWPCRWPQIAALVTCPVQFRLAEFERIWEATPEALGRIANTFTRTRIDAALLPFGGHLYEAHKRGPELVTEQLNFICAHVGRR